MAYSKKKKEEEAQKHFPPKCHYNPKHRGGIQASNSSTHHRQIHQSAFSPSKTIHTSLSLSHFFDSCYSLILVTGDFFVKQND